jgi:2-iminobutanoate/2-iminopropanoate deaminase
MTFVAHTPEGVRPPSGAYSTVVEAGPFIFVAGQGPFDVAGNLVGDDCASQTTQVLDNIKTALESVGASLSQVVKTSAFLANISDIGQLNTVYSTYFKPPLPVRTTVQAGLRGFLVEIDVVAYRG